MGDVINLRLARKARHRAEVAAAADENRTQHGRSRAERSSSAEERRRTERKLEAHRRGEPEPDGAA